MPLFRRDLQEIVTASLEDLAQNTNITRLSPGSKARALLESFGRRHEEIYQTFDLNLARAFVSSAPGQYLELIGELVGLTRASSVAASTSEEMETIQLTVDGGGTFGSINNNQDIVLPKGKVIFSTKASSNGIVYILDQNKVLRASATEDFCSATAAQPGSFSNVGSHSLVFHNFTTYSDYLNNSLKVTNLHAITSGKNFESDENFRFRIINRTLEAEAGNETALRLAALSTPGVADVLMVKHYRGIGTFGVIIKSITPTVSDTLITSVRANITNVACFGELPFVFGPKETGLSLKTTIHYKSRISEDDMEFIEDALESLIKNHVNSLDLGEEFSLNRLVADMFDISSQISSFGIPGTPIEELYVYKQSRLQDNKTRSKLLGDYLPANDERVIIEPSVSSPIVFERAFIRN